MGSGALALGCENGYTGSVANKSPRQFAIELARIAHDHKSQDVVALDLTGISAVMDYTVIATGSSQRQIRAVADALIQYGKKVGEVPYGSCGYENAAWVIVDYVDVVFHIFAPSYRQYYDLELLWGDAPKLEWAKSETA